MLSSSLNAVLLKPQSLLRLDSGHRLCMHRLHRLLGCRLLLGVTTRCLVITHDVSAHRVRLLRTLRLMSVISMPLTLEKARSNVGIEQPRSYGWIVNGDDNPNRMLSIT
jgi:hypothetical protein